ncbi:MAG TPA: protein kinase, partial [Thermoanaerobaculia bacterium]|nr:protein kinase [Thermoanaerobaculia bacterium]
MRLQPGVKLGPYEIVSAIGSGGMGEVYRARDTRLDREVAIKVLPDSLSSNPALRQRFEREARAISSLSHPNVCTLFDVGQQDGIDFLVMEYLEGESLAERLAAGPLPLEQVLRRGIEIAEALDRAHRHGVVHRDLKPGNIMLTRSGAKLLDFGLARIVQQNESPRSGLTNLPTEQYQRDLTAEGTVLGTFQYMAPEQLEGTEADARTDIFALGAVLYEMAAGRRAFEGKTKTSLIAAIVDRDPPPISSVQAMTPPALERLVKTCLAKDPDDRWQSAHDVASELRWILESGSQAGVAAPSAARLSRERIWKAGTITMALIAALLAVPLLRSLRERPDPLHLSIVPPSGTQLELVQDDAGALSVSPDGRFVTFSASEGGQQSLWLRDLRNPIARRLEGTDDASYPFWSPDSRWIAFFAHEKLRKIDIAGGPPVTIAEAPNGRGGSWSKTGVIVFEPH